MNIGKINIKNSKVSFNENNFNKNEKVIFDLISGIKALPKNVNLEIQNQIIEAAKTEEITHKSELIERIKLYLINNGLAIAQGLASSAIFEILKFLYSK